MPRQITQRGNRRQQAFFCDDGHECYLGLMAEWCDRCGVAALAYCLTPNHVHLVRVVREGDGRPARRCARPARSPLPMSSS